MISVQPEIKESQSENSKPQENGETNDPSSKEKPVVSKSKSNPSVSSTEIREEPVLSKMMKRCLSDVLHEGLLDSVLPYMIPKSALTQPNVKKTASEMKKTLSSSKSLEKQNHSSSNAISSKDKEKDKDKDKNKPKRLME